MLFWCNLISREIIVKRINHAEIFKPLVVACINALNFVLLFLDVTKISIKKISKITILYRFWRLLEVADNFPLHLVISRFFYLVSFWFSSLSRSSPFIFVFAAATLVTCFPHQTFSSFLLFTLCHEETQQRGIIHELNRVFTKGCLLVTWLMKSFETDKVTLCLKIF